jgi:peptidoglycan/LPS O-acetylase OafA/YrhL
MASPSVNAPARPAPLPGLRLAKRHFNALDLSRVIAAFFVLFWHYQHFFVPPVGYGFQVNRAAVIPLYHPLRWLFDYGHMAVQYFWAVSGFVFAHVYFADSTAMRRFWLARVARLWPLHLLTLVIVAGLQAAYTHINGTAFIYHEQDWKHFLLSIPLAHYWGWQHNQSFNGPSWSLSTEILAYAAFWVLLPALRRAPLLVALPLAVVVLRLFFLGWPNNRCSPASAISSSAWRSMARPCAAGCRCRCCWARQSPAWWRAGWRPRAGMPKTPRSWPAPLPCCSPRWQSTWPIRPTAWPSGASGAKPPMASISGIFRCRWRWSC